MRGVQEENVQMIPQQLQSPNIRFCRIQKGTKRPFEKDWTNKPYTYDEIKKFVPKENYGVLCGPGDLAVIDCDHEEMVDIVDKNFPKTFKVQTGSGGFHYYFFIPKLDKKIIVNKPDKDHTHLGEVQSHGTQVVGPGSLHPNGNKYSVVANFPIATLELDKVLDVLKPYMDEVAKTVEEADYEKRTYSEIDNMSVADIWGTAGMKQSARGEFFGPHPIHGSGGGMNFWINTNKNTWHCFTKECPVFTKDGVKQIRELKANDYVVGKQGKLQKCISTFKRKYKGKVYKIGWNKLNQFEVTEGHPFLIVTKGSEKAPIWKPIEEINFHKERFVVPKKFGNLKEINLKEFIKVDYETKKLKIPKKIKLNKQFGKIVGWYLAEGHISKRTDGHLRLNFTLGYNKYNEALKLANLIKQELNVKLAIHPYESRGSIICTCHSQPLARLFKNYFKTGSKNKSLGRLINANKFFLKGVTETYIKGNGHKRKNGQIIISSVSKNLILEIQYVLLKLGIIVGGGYKTNESITNSCAKNDRYIISFNGKKTHKNHYQDKQNIYLKLNKYKEYKKEEIVYNLETEDHSYLIPLISHNCFRCLCYDSRVTTPNGVKKIQNLKVGDEVFGKEFQKNIIKKIFSRTAKEKIYKLKTYTPPIEVTEGHPFYIASIKYKGKHLVKNNPSYSWKEISQINPKKDFLVVPKKHVPYLFKKGGFTLDKKFGELLGWYLAEGHIHNTHKTCIQLTLGLKSAGEKKAKRLCNLARLQGAKAKYYIYKDKGTILVQIHSKKLRNFILKEIGSRSNEKQLNELINAPMSFLKTLIDNYIAADGGFSNNKKQKRISSTSENLIREVQTILFKQGIPARYYIPQKNNPKTKNPLHLLQWTLNPKHKSEFQDKNNLYLPIKLEETTSNKKVYNLETQDNTFLLPFIVHNCNTGGGPLAAIAVKEGIINCSDARPGYLRGDKAIDAIKIAEEKYNLVIKERVKVKKAMKSFTKSGQAELFDELQPIYYDQAGLWWLWEDTSKKWKRVDDVDILNMVEDATGMDTVSSKMKTEILNALKQRGRRRKIKKMKPTWIQFRDKIIDIETGQEFTATPDYFVTNPIPWETHPEKFENTPVMDKIFAEWVGKENIKTLYEILAYSLIPSYPIHRIFCFLGGGMNGKCQTKGSKVLMADGSWKNIENIKVGDKVISPQEDGSQKIAKVKGIHSRFEPNIYEVRENKRKKRLLYTCAGNHEVPIIKWWTQRTSKDDSTPRIRKRKLFHYEAQRLSRMYNYKSDICSFSTSAVDFNHEEKVDPYCLGAWLGDGCLIGSNLNITLGPKKKEIKEYFEKKIGFQGNYKKKDGLGLGVSYRISQKSEFVKYLKKKGIKSHNKFIPKECLLSSKKFRWNLLAGLIDTDGFIQKSTGAIYYTTKSKQLSEDIKNLVFSLGGYCEIRNISKKSQTGFVGKYKELSIQFFDPLKIPLKTWKKTRLKKLKYDPRHIGIEVVKKEKGEEVYGFELDSNETHTQWYITDNWMITHNSCFLELLRRFVGHENCCSTELDTLLISRFEVTRLHKKLVCQMGETDFSEMKKTSILKKLSGGDLIGFEYKNKDPFEEKNYAKILISTNNLPTTTDKTIGFYRRWMIIDFPNTFSEKKDILEDIPTEEYKSLALKSISILKDLLQKRSFHREGSVEERMKKYEDSSDPLQKFINTFCVEDLNSDIPKSGFEKRYNDWAKDNNFRQMSDMTIGRRMKSKGIESGRRYVHWLHEGRGGQMRVWLGIKWKDEWKEF